MTAHRWAWAEIDLDALDHNVRLVRELVAPAAVWAVVKADGYGHGASAIATQALRSGAAGLCVALAQEGIDLRRAGIEAPILVLSEQPPDEVGETLAAGLTPTVYSTAYVDALAAAVASGAAASCHVHVKVDTGMQRVGAQPAAAVALLAHVRALEPQVSSDAVYTHLACADDLASPANAAQLASFTQVLAELDDRGLRPMWTHAANSAGALGDHLEVRLNHVEDVDDDDGDTPGGDAPDETSGDDFADPGTREIELRAVGPAWTGRWDRIARAVESFRC